MSDSQQAVGVAPPAVGDPKKPTAGSLLADLSAERAEVRVLVSGLDQESWGLPTTPGWSVRDQVAHLAYYDAVAAVSVGDPERFAEIKERALADIPAFEEAHLRAVPADGAALLEEWARAGEEFRGAAEHADPTSRVPWFGPDMGLLSMISARLMETWAHGQDVADGLGARREPTDRLRHVVGLAVRARPQGFVVRELAIPETPVRVELTAPDGELWTYGPDSAAESISGPAEDFCLVLTRRRHVDDTTLEHRGPAAREWLEIGQAYAGPAGPGPRRRRDSRTGVR